MSLLSFMGRALLVVVILVAWTMLVVAVGWIIEQLGRWRGRP